MAASSGDRSAGGGGVRCGSAEESACSTPFASAPSSPDHDPSFSAAGCFHSVPVSPAHGGPNTADEYGCKLGFDFDFDFSSHCPSPAAAAMSSADEFHNGQIRPMRLASFLLRPQVLTPLNGGVPTSNPPPQPPSESAHAGADERGRLRSRSVHRRYRSLSPFRAHWLSPSSSPARAAKSVIKAAGEVALSASRSSSSSSTASSASSSSSRSYRRWDFLKHIFHRSNSDGGQRPPLPSSPSPAAPEAKRSPSPSSAASRGRGRARRSVHERLYKARHAEADEMRRRTFLPYRQGLLLGFIGLGSCGYGDLHGFATAAAAAAVAGKARP